MDRVEIGNLLDLQYLEKIQISLDKDKRKFKNKDFDGIEYKFLTVYDTDRQKISTKEYDANQCRNILVDDINACIFKYPIKRIIDIGCGIGDLLPIFKKMGIFSKGIKYVGIDYRDRLVKAFDNAGIINVSKYCQFFEFNDQWIEENADYKNESCLVIYRKKLDEPDPTIEDVAGLLYDICAKLPDDWHIIIEGFAVPPKSYTLRQWGWIGDHIAIILNKGGIDGICKNNTSIEGACVYTIIGSRNAKCNISKDDINKLLKYSLREKLYQLIGKYKNIYEMRDQNNLLVRIDFEIRALIDKLIEIGELKVPDASGDTIWLFKQAFDRIDEKAISVICGRFIYPNTFGFQNRDNHVNDIDNFLRSTDAIYFLYGPPFIGKSYVITHALSLKIKHERLPIIIDLSHFTDLYGIIEAIIKQLNVYEYIDAEPLYALKKMPPDDLKRVLSESINKISKNTILIIDRYERIIESDNLSPERDSERQDTKEIINWLLDTWSMGVNAKIIIMSRIIDRVPYEKIKFAAINSFKGDPERRYIHTIDLLNVFVPTKYRLLDKYKQTGGYPEDLLETINNHPYIANLAARMIRNNISPNCLGDAVFIANLKSGLCNFLLLSLDISLEELEMIHVLPMVKVPVPLKFVILATDECTANRLIYNGLLIESSHGYYKPLMVLEHHNVLDVYIKDKWNRIFANIFMTLYNETNDPSYIRQAYDHAFACNETNIIDLIFNEMIVSAFSWYESGYYENTLWAYQAMEEAHKHVLSLKEKMIKASCLIRTGYIYNNLIEGEQLFNDLSKNYWGPLELKYLWVDSLLYLNKRLNSSDPVYINKAIEILENTGGKQDDFYWYWHMAQCYSQIPDRLKTYEYCRKSIHLYYSEDRSGNNVLDEIWPVFHEMITRARDFNDSSVEEEIVNLAVFRFPQYTPFRIDLGLFKARTGSLEEAKKIFMGVQQDDPANPYYILPLVKVLCKLNEFSAVENILNARYDSEIMKEVLGYAYIYFYIIKKDYLKAEDMINQIMRKSETLIDTDRALIIKHYLCVSLYLSWAREFDSKKSKEKALEGLKWGVNKITNVSVLNKGLELAKIAGDQKMENVISSRIHSLNNSL